MRTNSHVAMGVIRGTISKKLQGSEYGKRQQMQTENEIVSTVQDLKNI